MLLDLQNISPGRTTISSYSISIFSLFSVYYLEGLCLRREEM